MRTRLGNPVVTTLMLLMVTGAGCSRTAPARFYMLSDLRGASEAGAPMATQSPCLTLGIGPIEMPDYLDRPQIVTQLGPNELHLGDFDQWAEPLGKTFMRTLSDNLASLLCDPYVELPAPLPERLREGACDGASRGERRELAGSVSDGSQGVGRRGGGPPPVIIGSAEKGTAMPGRGGRRKAGGRRGAGHGHHQVVRSMTRNRADVLARFGGSGGSRVAPHGKAQKIFLKL